MKHVWGQISYRLRLSMVIALFAIIPLTIFGVFYLQSERVKWETAALNDYAQMLAVTSEKLDNGIQEMQQKIMYMRNSVPITAALSRIDKMGLTEGLDFINVLRESVDTITADNNYLSIRWYSYLSNHDYGGYCYTLKKFEEEFDEEDPLLGTIMKIKSGELFLVVRNIDREWNAGKNMSESVCIYTKISNPNGSDCLLEISMPVERMLEIENVRLPDGSVFGLHLKTDNGWQTLLLSSDEIQEKKLLETYHLTGKCPEFYAYVNRVAGLDGSQISCLFPKDYVAGLVRKNVVNFSMIVILFTMTVLVCSYLAATMLTNRIKRFIEKMNTELDTILTEPSVQIIRDSDFQGIEKRIRKLILSTQEHYEMIEQYEVEKNRLELELLQIRINPHFLYNTLTSICYQVKEKEIRKSIESLIRYYRIVLSNGHLMIQIEEEITMIREYLELEIFSYQLMNIRYYFEIDENVNRFTVIKHLLQPIVENALEHGVRANDEMGTIRIGARLEGKDIIFEIEDNGAGMTTEQIEQVLTQPPKSSTGGYGIYNVQQRIETYYGKGYGLQFESVPGMGTCVIIRIPQKVNN